MKKTVYLTYGDSFSGVYKSQVIDVVKFLKNKINKNITLIAVISLRNFMAERKKIKANIPEAKVIPMFPKINNLLKNKPALKFLSFFMNFDTIIARGPLATYLCQDSFKSKKIKIIYDGRGANKEEEREYNVSDGILTYSELEKFERAAVLNSDFRIAVSQKLVEYWQKEFNYSLSKHVIIPCMLGSYFENKTLDINKIEKKRKELGYKKDDIVLIYSGSIAGWQSFDFLYNFLSENLSENNSVKVMFLSKNHDIITKLQTKFPNKIKRYWLPVSEVFDYLSVGDYGILFREQTVTNKVASPVKFAEYLSAGLNVLISENLGDFSEFTEKNKCGFIVSKEKNIVQLKKQEISQKIFNRDLAIKYFTKNQAVKEYSAIFN